MLTNSCISEMKWTSASCVLPGNPTQGCKCPNFPTPGCLFFLFMPHLRESSHGIPNHLPTLKGTLASPQQKLSIA